MAVNPKKRVRAAARVLTANLRLLSGKILHGRKLRFSPTTCLALSDAVELSLQGSLDLGSGLRTRGRCVFNVQGEGELTVGRNVFLNSGCQLHCRSAISIGDGCEFGPNVLVYDHDHDYRGGGLKNGAYLLADVTIGPNCWIGANTVILRGSTIGEGSVIAAGCIIKGDVPAQTLVFQRRSSEVRHV